MKKRISPRKQCCKKINLSIRNVLEMSHMYGLISVTWKLVLPVEEEAQTSPALKSFPILYSGVICGL